MNCSRKSWTEYIISHAECTSTSNPTRQGNPFRGAVGDLDRSNCSAQSSTGRNASIPPNLPFYLMDYLVINVQLVIAICVRKKGAVALNPGFPNNHTSIQESSNNYCYLWRASNGLTPRSRYSCSCFIRTSPCAGAFPGSR